MHPIFKRRRDVRINFLARQLAFTLTHLGSGYPQTSFPLWMSFNEWATFLDEESNLDRDVLKELVCAAVDFAPAAFIYDLRPYAIAAMLKQLSNEEQHLLLATFKRYCAKEPACQHSV